MATFQERLITAFNREQSRRLNAGEPRLTRTELWKAAGKTSGAATHWFNGSNGMDMDVCIKVSTILRVNPFWLFDESKDIGEGLSPSSDTQSTSSTVESPNRLPVRTKRERRIAAIVEQLNATDDEGLAIVLDKAKDVARDYPLSAQKTGS